MSIADKHIVFGGAGGRGMSTPWGTLGEIADKALTPHGYDLYIERESWGVGNPRWVGDGKVDFGATQLRAVRQAYDGTGPYAGDAPRDHLRVIACINHPGWFAMAVRAETNITDLAQVREQQLPVRVLNRASSSAMKIILDHYGLSREMIESWGGRFLVGDETVAGVSGQAPLWIRTGEFDIIVGYLYASYTLEVRVWHDASILHNMRFLQMPDSLIQAIATEIGGRPGTLPHHLVRGIDTDMPAPRRGHQAYYGRSDMPDDFVRLLAQALDENRDLFRSVHLPFSYDPDNVADTGGLPLHPAAEAYYREKGYVR